MRLRRGEPVRSRDLICCIRLVWYRHGPARSPVPRTRSTVAIVRVAEARAWWGARRQRTSTVRTAGRSTLEKLPRRELRRQRGSTVRIAGRSTLEKRACSGLPHLTRPGWPVNGSGAAAGSRTTSPGDVHRLSTHDRVARRQPRERSPVRPESATARSGARASRRERSCPRSTRAAQAVADHDAVWRTPSSAARRWMPPDPPP